MVIVQPIVKSAIDLIWQFYDKSSAKNKKVRQAALFETVRMYDFVSACRYDRSSTAGPSEIDDEHEAGKTDDCPGSDAPAGFLNTFVHEQPRNSVKLWLPQSLDAATAWGRSYRTAQFA